MIGGDEKVDYDAIAKYHEMRNATLKFVTDTRPLEKSDATKAIERYSEALARAREYEHFAVDRQLFPLIAPSSSPSTSAFAARRVSERLEIPVPRSRVSRRATRSSETEEGISSEDE